MRITLLESNRSFFQTAECACLSVLAHAGLIWGAVAATEGGRQLPVDEREARVFFLLPPDKVDVRTYQMETIQWAREGGDIHNGPVLTKPGEGWSSQPPAHGARARGKDETGARGQLPIGLTVADIRPDTAFSVLEVDEEVERHEWSAAPLYPPELLAQGAEGVVFATFVVDTTGLVDSTSVRFLTSSHPMFTSSVRDALNQMHFKPAVRRGEKVRQLVEQHFRFQIAPAPEIAKQMS
ncbi:MAG TPA: energy transducer TonB [Gemmatimonadales bacterium]|nr:energy transducer TonB [Gemmatimonadales bacterium]